MSKHLIVTRGGQAAPHIVKYTQFDSTIDVMCAESNSLIYHHPYAVTNHYNGYAGGILAEDDYGWICYEAHDMVYPQAKVLYLFRKEFIGKVKVFSDLQEDMRVFVSLVPNPNWQGQRKITDVLNHNDNTVDPEKGGWSDGCLTIYPGPLPDMKLMTEYWALFSMGEVGTLTLKRQPGWEAPEFYQGK